VRTVRPVEVGEALTISYVDLVLPPRQRQAILLRRYAFLCDCDACAADPVAGKGHARLWCVNAVSAQTPCKLRSSDEVGAQQGTTWMLEPGQGDLTADMEVDLKLLYQKRQFEARTLSHKATEEWERATRKGLPCDACIPLIEVCCICGTAFVHARHFAPLFSLHCVILCACRERTAVINDNMARTIPRVWSLEGVHTNWCTFDDMPHLTLAVQQALDKTSGILHPAHWLETSLRLQLVDFAEACKHWCLLEKHSGLLIQSLPLVLFPMHPLVGQTFRQRGVARMALAQKKRLEEQANVLRPTPAGALENQNSGNQAVNAGKKGNKGGKGASETSVQLAAKAAEDFSDGIAVYKTCFGEKHALTIKLRKYVQLCVMMQPQH
jgi:hypothetical protein